MMTARSNRAIVSCACALGLLAVPLPVLAQSPVEVEAEAEAEAEADVDAAPETVAPEAAAGVTAEAEPGLDGEVDAVVEGEAGAPVNAETQAGVEAEAEAASPDATVEVQTETEAVEPPAPEVDALPAGPERPDEPRVGNRPYNGKGLIIAGAATTGLGVAFLATSIIITRCEPASPLACRYGPQRTLLVPSAVAVTALGVTLLSVGLVKKSRYKRWQEWTPGQEAVLAPAVNRNSAGFVYHARF